MGPRPLCHTGLVAANRPAAQGRVLRIPPHVSYARLDEDPLQARRLTEQVRQAALQCFAAPGGQW